MVLPPLDGLAALALELLVEGEGSQAFAQGSCDLEFESFYANKTVTNTFS